MNSEYAYGIDNTLPCSCFQIEKQADVLNAFSYHIRCGKPPIHIIAPFVLDLFKTRISRDLKEKRKNYMLRAPNCSDIEIEYQLYSNAVINIPQVILDIPLNDVKSLEIYREWSVYREVDMILTKQRNNITYKLLGNQSVLLFPYTIESPKTPNTSVDDVDHMVLFAVYMESNVIVMYDSLEREMGLKRVYRLDTIDFTVLNSKTYIGQKKRCFHLIEKFAHACIMHQLIGETRSKSAQVVARQKKFGDFLRNFSFYTDGYPAPQTNMDCGKYVMFGMHDIMLNYPCFERMRKNRAHIMSADIRNKHSNAKNMKPNLSQTLEISRLDMLSCIVSNLVYIAVLCPQSIPIKKMIASQPITVAMFTLENDNRDVALRNTLSYSISKKLPKNRYVMNKRRETIYGLKPLQKMYVFSSAIDKESLQDQEFYNKFKKWVSTLHRYNTDMLIVCYPHDPKNLRDFEKYTEIFQRIASHFTAIIFIIPGHFVHFQWKTADADRTHYLKKLAGLENAMQFYYPRNVKIERTYSNAQMSRIIPASFTQNEKIYTKRVLMNVPASNFNRLIYIQGNRWLALPSK